MKGVDFPLRVRLTGEKAEGQRVKVVLLDHQGVLLPKYRKKVCTFIVISSDHLALK